MGWLEAAITEKDWSKVDAIVQQIFIREQSQVVMERNSKISSEESAAYLAMAIGGVAKKNEAGINSAESCTSAIQSNANLAVSVWIECRDENSGVTYYFNQSTGETSWANPSALSSTTDASHWQVAYDNDGKAYYYNPETGEAAWSDPT
ncbi:hypothetical protein PHYBOEH_002381 [Phytophthora boehmeriae]|uniref:WW domain-containing protein n=1 Tax=Phytophthora boehmeriae TaxID=109152 RepID=A0A8T1X554_9STRA|nr:hypothetical protein PHYBOEH_002381 [Phytophthora boehmeriae]